MSTTMSNAPNEGTAALDAYMNALVPHADDPTRLTCSGCAWEVFDREGSEHPLVGINDDGIEHPARCPFEQAIQS